nr:cell division protein FtsQ/DivIB [Halovulum dunhuangense]
MDLDLDALHQRVAGLDAVATAQVRVEGGGLLRIIVEERVPAVVWRLPGREAFVTLDATGVRVGGLETRADRADLPLIAGPGADKAAAEALELLALAAPVADRIGGLLRVGERRWSLVLRDGPEIMLPETGAASALARVMALDAAEDILARDLAVVDMRDARRPILRLTSNALLELRRARGEIVEEDA